MCGWEVRGTMELDGSSCRYCEDLTSMHLSVLDLISRRMVQARYISNDNVCGLKHHI